MKTDLRKYGNIFKQEGTARVERYLPALDPSKTVIDNRTLTGLLLYAQRYMKNVRFFGAGDNSEIKSWAEFFDKDVLFLIAGIAAKDTKEIKATYDFLKQQFDASKSADELSKLCDYIFSRFDKLYTWYAHSVSHEYLHKDLETYIESYIEKKLQDFYSVAAQVKNLSSYDNTSSYKILTASFGDQSHKATRRGKNEDEVFIAGNNDIEKLNNASLHLNEIFDSVFHVTDTIVKNCTTYFNETLKGRQNHPPHIALLVAFLKLYGYVQDDLNTLPQKQLDYYYQQVLGIQLKEAVADQAYILFELAKGFDIYKLSKGSYLSAGKDKKNVELLYRTDKDLVINKAQVSVVKTLLAAKDDQKRVTNFYTDTFTAAEDNTISPAPWNTFGVANAKNVASIGFAIASDQLFLSQGDRNITISFSLAEDINIEEFDTNIISIMLTGEKGWLHSNVPADDININALQTKGARTLELNCSIAITQQSAIGGFIPAKHGGNYHTTAPVLQCLLQYPAIDENDTEYDSKINQLNILQTLQVTGVVIKTAAGNVGTGVSFDGVRNLILQNHEADLNSNKPFYPFTGNPKTGSSFYISCKELLNKPVQKAAVNIEWMLPGNFKSYYDNYFPPYNSNKFKASLSILHQNLWKKMDDVSVIDVDGFNPIYRSIKIDYSNLPGIDETDSDIAKADFSKMEGTLKFKLNYPDFGHSIYPQLITSSVMNKSATKNSAENYSKIISKQLHDSVISIKLPDDMDQRKGSLKTVHDIIALTEDDERAKKMLAKALGDKLRQFNGSNVVTGSKPANTAAENATVPSLADSEGKVIVNDDNMLNKVFGFLKRLRLIDRETFYDQDKQTLESVVTAVNEDIVTKANFILPPDNELIALIMNETNIAISKTVVKITDEIIVQRKNGNADPAKTAAIIKKEFEDANKVINDIIAEKIATLLLANEVPPPPYTPLANSLSLNYTAEKECVAGVDRFFQITAFGVTEINPLQSEDVHEPVNDVPVINSKYLFPQAGVFVDAIKQQTAAMFFIGMKNVVQDENISFLFQFAEGTGKLVSKPASVNWYYLSGNQWQPFTEEAFVSDTTFGLQTTGIIEFSIPTQLNNVNTGFPEKQQYWIAALVENDPASFPQLINISTNVVTVTFINRHNDPAHFALPLPAKKITKLSDAVPAVKRITQPLASFNGKIKEEGKAFYVRVSERLRHKSRAINNWDFERLVLENFATVFKVKCINNYYNGNYAPGHVTVVPVCDLRNSGASNVNLLYPKAGYILLHNIEQLLSSKASPFIRIHAVNPKLDHILISCRVKFNKGVDKGYYLKQLNAELVQFLTPWADGGIDAPSFSSKVYASSVINFIDKRKYVDYVTGLVMEQYSENEKEEKEFYKMPDGTISLNESQFSTAHSILVSAPEHNIELVD